MRRRGVLAIALVAVGLTGCDSPFVRVGAGRSGWNPGEPTRSAAELADYDERWEVDLGGEPRDPVVAGGTVFVSWDAADEAEGGVVALAAETGDERWSYDATPGTSPPPAFLSAPGVAGGEVYVGVEQIVLSEVRGTVVALDAASGGSGRVVSDEPGLQSPIRVGDVVYAPWLLAHGRIGIRGDGIQGVDVDTGDVVFGALGMAGAVAVAGERLYAVVENQLRAYSLTDRTRCQETTTIPGAGDPTLDCEPLWSGSVPTTTSRRNTPAVHGGVVYVGGAGGVLAFDADGCGAATCAPVWTGATGGPVRTDAAVDGRTVVVGADDGKVHAFPATGCGAATCSATWTATPGRGFAVESSPTLASGFVFVGAETGHVRAYTATGCGRPTCAPVWTEVTGAPVRTSPAVANGTVVVADVSGTVHLYGAPD